jgi:hypothetical protein
MSISFFPTNSFINKIGNIPELNVNNSNAGYILQLLEIEFDYCGSIEPTDLLARVAAARHCFNSSAMYNGTPKRYLDTLADIANWAIDNDIPTVTWG